jgi:hypothetical protein
MKHQSSTKCNCCECIWKRINLNASKSIELRTIRLKRVSYTIDNNRVKWEPRETQQKKLYNQTQETICNCLNARRENLGPSQYPSTARSYIWALLNHPEIWK